LSVPLLNGINSDTNSYELPENSGIIILYIFLNSTEYWIYELGGIIESISLLIGLIVKPPDVFEDDTIPFGVKNR
jgi:hypothetical protein